MASKRFTLEEVIAHLDSDNSDESDLAELEDNEGLDGDREEAEYTNSQGEAEVVSFSTLSSTVDNLLQVDADPASQDSMLSDLESISDCDMEVDPTSPISYSGTSDDTVSSSEDAEQGQKKGEHQGRGRGRSRRRGHGRGVGRGRGMGVGRGRGRGRRGRGLGSSDSSVDKEWKWEKEWNDDSSISAPPEFDEDTGPKCEALECNKPDKFFHLMFTDELVDIIVTNTNLYATQQGSNVVFSREDIMGYIGLNIAMGVVNLPNIQDYWTREPILQIPWFSTVMSQRKFLTLTRCLHFANNTNSLPRTDPSFDKLWKIRQVIEVIKQRCKKIYSPGKCVSVDESMIGTCGRLSFLQYLPKKPTKWGIKLWVCAESKTGYIYNFEVYTRQGDRCEHGLAYRVVMCMVNDLLESGRIVYVDNFYTSPQLFEDLYHQGMYAS